jgi:putative membrane protein
LHEAAGAATIPRMGLDRLERTVLIFTLLYLVPFTGLALTRFNYEFLLYAAVVVVLLLWIVWKQPTVKFEPAILWGLSGWGLLHMAGGNLRVGDGVLYSVQLIPKLLRYDQLVHAFGFGVATLVCFHILRPFLREDIARWRTPAVLVVLMGSGVGAINEIVEYVAVLAMPETGVGGYDNTMQDLVFNLIGGIAAVLWLAWRRDEPPRLA